MLGCSNVKDFMNNYILEYPTVAKNTSTHCHSRYGVHKKVMASLRMRTYRSKDIIEYLVSNIIIFDPLMTSDKRYKRQFWGMEKLTKFSNQLYYTNNKGCPKNVSWGDSVNLLKRCFWGKTGMFFSKIDN